MADDEEQSKYAQSGVDFKAERDTVEIMKRGYQETKDGVADVTERLAMKMPDEIGSFSDSVEMDLEGAVKKGAKLIRIAPCTDGAGTKPVAHILYIEGGGDDPIKRACTGIDAVMMVVNDAICSGARPFIIQNYVAWHANNLEIAKDLQSGLVIGCGQAGASNTGGENASLSAMITEIMPGKGYDICAFGIGFVMEPHLLEKPLDGSRLKPGDDIIGVASSGAHCNGITLLWKTAIGYEEHEFNQWQRINEHDEILGETPAEAILTPTLCYKVPVLDKVLANPAYDVKAAVNVTGEGVGNDFRALKTNGLAAFMDFSDISMHPVFRWVQERAGVSPREMLEVYNNGVGMRLYTNPKDTESVMAGINATEIDGTKFRAFKMGKVIDEGKTMVSAKYQGETHNYEP